MQRGSCHAGDVADLGFQYPRSDRRRCNSSWRPSGTAANSLLSVSSVGSEAMQRFRQPYEENNHQNFQYPRSDRRRCNLRQRSLAVRWRMPFSILGRIGGDATSATERSCQVCVELSVSSVGSEAMQHCGSGRWRGGWPCSFSILGRIGGDATRTAREGANRVHVLSVSSVGSEAMQPVYSVSFSPDGQMPFSILGRIGGDATSTEPADQAEKLEVFQYPRSDRRRCNSGRNKSCEDWRRLSVSSVGSEAMQPHSLCWVHRHSVLSVSSVGSEAMQPGTTRIPATPSSTFSILGRIGGDATM